VLVRQACKSLTPSKHLRFRECLSTAALSLQQAIADDVTDAHWYGLLTSGHNQMKRALLFSLNCPTAATIIYNSPLPPASETDIHHDQSW
jgi:hypothetical protein